MCPIGTIRLSINTEALTQIQKNIDFASEGKVLILDEKNEIVQGQESVLSKRQRHYLPKQTENSSMK